MNRQTEKLSTTQELYNIYTEISMHWGKWSQTENKLSWAPHKDLKHIEFSENFEVNYVKGKSTGL
jgi:hypothetical protein